MPQETAEVARPMRGPFRLSRVPQTRDDPGDYCKEV